MIEKREGLKEDRRKREGRAEFPRHRRPHRQRRRPPTHTVPSLNLPLLASNPSMASKELPAMRLPSLPLAPPAPPRHGNRESEPWGGRGVCGGGGAAFSVSLVSPHYPAVPSRFEPPLSSLPPLTALLIRGKKGKWREGGEIR